MVQWEKATLEQLECILKHDKDCPLVLLCFVTSEVERRFRSE
jgi:hypothetical protein